MFDKEAVANAAKSLGNPPAPPEKAFPVQANPDKVKPEGGVRAKDPMMPMDRTAAPLAVLHKGTDYVPKTGNYRLEQGEAVVPKEKNMADDIFAHVPHRGSESKPKKEIKEMVHSKSHNGKHIVVHKHHHPAHPDETHVLNDMAELHQHMEDHAGTPNEGEGAPDASMAQMTPAQGVPAPPPAAAGAPPIQGAQ